MDDYDSIEKYLCKHLIPVKARHTSHFRDDVFYCGLKTEKKDYYIGTEGLCLAMKKYSSGHAGLDAFLDEELLKKCPDKDTH